MYSSSVKWEKQEVEKQDQHEASSPGTLSGTRFWEREQMDPERLEMDVPDSVCAQSPTAEDVGGDHSINGRRPACLRAFPPRL